MHIRVEKHLRPNEMFNEFEQFEDLGQVSGKNITEKRYERPNIRQ